MVLRVSGIDFAYAKTPVLNAVSFEAHSGELIALLGPNGCGKTTLIKCINGILAPSCGTVTLDGEKVAAMKGTDRARRIAYVPQMTHTDTGGTVLDTVIMGRKPYITWKLANADIDAALAVLRKLNMEETANLQYTDLSGGQKQKVIIARALAQNPSVYLFDEPTSFLDIKNQVEIMKITHDIVRYENKIVIMVIHDINMALRYAGRSLLLREGRVKAFGGTRAILTPKNIKDVYEIDTELINGIYIVPV